MRSTPTKGNELPAARRRRIDKSLPLDVLLLIGGWDLPSKVTSSSTTRRIPCFVHEESSRSVPAIRALSGEQADSLASMAVAR